MKIKLVNGTWVVIANWLGAPRIVYKNDNIFACIRWVNRAS
jgi:hypothetical protein